MREVIIVWTLRPRRRNRSRETETMAFLGQYPVRCKIVVITNVYKRRILNISVVKYSVLMKKIFNKD
jgi:hypothetical protein